MTTSPRSRPPILGRRALNRALLARQLLIGRAELGALAAVEHLVGMQAQVPTSPYVGLWCRLRDFRPDDVAGPIERREAVRIALMRSTIHLVSARDCLALRPLLQPVVEREIRHGAVARALAGADLGAVAAAARELVEEQPRAPGELGRVLAERLPGYDADALAHAARALLPLVQLPPRGLWTRSGRTLLTTAEAWLGRPLQPDASLEALVLRYLGAFGPGSVVDVQAWSGLTRLREVAERLGPRLRRFRDEEGRELLDLDDAPLPDPDTPAPPVFLPEYDNVVLGHADRTRIVPAPLRERVLRALGTGMVLVDGVVGATWRVVREAGVPRLVIEPFARIEEAAVAEEGARLLEFLAPGEDGDVRVTAPA